MIISKYKRLIGLILIALLVAVGATYLYILHSHILIFIAGLPILLCVLYAILKQQEGLYHKIDFFFSAMDNEDYSIRFAENKRASRLETKLHTHLNSLKHSIEQHRIALRQQEEYYSLLLDNVAIGVLTINSQGEIVQVNQATKDLLNYPHLSHIEQLRQVSLQLYHTIKNIDHSQTHLVHIPHPLKTMQVSVKAAHLQLASKEQLRLISLQDIRKELDDKELDSWIKLIRVLIHEIMNTIAPITSLSASLVQYRAEPLGDDFARMPRAQMENVSKGVQIIHERSKGLMSFVEACRKITRIPMAMPEHIDLQMAFDTIKILLSAEANYKRMQLSIDIQPADLQVYADKNHFHFVMINLLKNAVAAVSPMGKKARIVVAARVLPTGECSISVIDNGLGIPADILDEIFVPFFTTKEQGSGIGLYVARQMLQLHKGSLKVFSKPGKTIFTAEFPPKLLPSKSF